MRAYTKTVAVATFLLLLAGGMVTSTGSGLSVPDWPLSFGTWFPAMEGGVLYEHGHRMIASVVGLLIVVEGMFVLRGDERRWVRGVAWAATLGVVFQGLLGGLTVLLRLPDVVSVGHALTAELVFALVVVLAVAYSRGWRVAADEPRSLDVRTPSTYGLAVLTATVVLVQILIGAIVRHTGAGLAIPDFPLAYGQLVPPLESRPVAVHFAHRIGALAVAICVALVFVRSRRAHAGDRYLSRPVVLMAWLVVIQIGLGGWTVLSYKAAGITTGHLGVGALLWATSVVFALRARQRLALRPDPAHPPIRPLTTEPA